MEDLICDCPLCKGVYYTKNFCKNILKKINKKEKYKLKNQNNLPNSGI